MAFWIATPVFRIVSDEGSPLRIQGRTFQIAGAASEVFQVGDVLYVDVERYLDQVAVQVLDIAGFGGAPVQIERGRTGLIIVALTPEAIPQVVLHLPEHLYRIEVVEAAAPQPDKRQIAFIPPHLM